MISPADKKDYPVLIAVWESAVKATHDFLSDEDFEFYKKHIPIYFEHVSLYKYKDDKGVVKAFLGVADNSIEMLFVDNESRGSINFARIKVNLLTGVTFICSIVPVSFSPTMFRAGRNPASKVSNITISAGTINTL